ncbi:HMG box family protein [Tritrichomonas foetus]|uniref:HMG box family protein n=1 Tax=Tritrichomonas foetus TaxID=1144522 RepID=A0A1J4K4C8_9EUKA|nr:HMG box family protein [Tritrichomonas foetus]|eukprot:OHT04612.1 HMG box family protein [Tritrichomonas foetus]
MSFYQYNLNMPSVITKSYQKDLHFFHTSFIMYKWEPSLISGDFSSIDLQNQIYGFNYDKNPVTRAMSATDTEGFSQFQPTLLGHKNDTTNIEYNPLDVFNNAMRYQAANTKPRQTKTVNRKAPNCRSGYLLYSQEMRPIIQRRNPDLAFGEVTKIVAQTWNELSSVEQEDYCHRARLTAEPNEENNNGDLNNQDMYFNMGQNAGHGDDIGLAMGDAGGTGLYNLGGHFPP